MNDILEIKICIQINFCSNFFIYVRFLIINFLKKIKKFIRNQKILFEGTQTN